MGAIVKVQHKCTSFLVMRLSQITQVIPFDEVCANVVPQINATDPRQ